MKTPQMGMSVLVARAGALLAAGSAALHGASLDQASLGIAVVTVVMLVGCLYCAYELWVHDTVRSWLLVAVMNLVMIGVHLPMTGGHSHGAGSALSSTAGPTPMQLATGVALVEVLLAATVLFLRTRALGPAASACQSGGHDAGTGRPAGRDLDRLPEPN